MRLRRVFLLLLVALVPAFLTGWLHPRRPDWHEAFHPIPTVTLAGLRAMPVVPRLWIDAREPRAYAQAHLPGALNLSETAWETCLPAVIDAWTPECRVVVYCDGGACQAARATARRLRRELGADNIVILGDGWPALSSLKAAP